jgi:hypothetical protein
MGGPEVRGFDDLARSWLDAHRRSRRIVRVPVLGRTAHAFKQGVNLCPDRADGVETWEHWLSLTSAT